MPKTDADKAREKALKKEQPRCPFCKKYEPKIRNASYNIPDVGNLVLMVFYCGSCQSILSTQMVPLASKQPEKSNLILPPGAVN